MSKIGDERRALLSDMPADVFDGIMSQEEAKEKMQKELSKKSEPEINDEAFRRKQKKLNKLQRKIDALNK
mgnify:CR=1 FL=1